MKIKFEKCVYFVQAYNKQKKPLKLDPLARRLCLDNFGVHWDDYGGHLGSNLSWKEEKIKDDEIKKRFIKKENTIIVKMANVTLTFTPLTHKIFHKHFSKVPDFKK